MHPTLSIARIMVKADTGDFQDRGAIAATQAVSALDVAAAFNQQVVAVRNAKLKKETVKKKHLVLHSKKKKIFLLVLKRQIEL